MMRRILLLVALLLLPALDARAGIFFNRGKKDKVDPKIRVPELITAIRSDRDANKRAQAAEELQEYDARMFPDILPVLIEAMQKDENPTVRIEAIQGVGRIRPVTAAAGQALEHVLANDRAMRVRLQARSTLLGYSWAGYRTGMKDAPTVETTAKTPPVINTTSPKNSTSIRIAPTPPTPVRPGTTTQEPPLAPPVAPVAPPVTPVAPPAVKTETPVPVAPIPLPTGPAKSEGPTLPDLN